MSPTGHMKTEAKMRLNHVDLPVADIPGARDFFVEHFGFRCIFEGEEGLTVLLDEADFALTLSALTGHNERRYPTGFHIGFNLDSEAQLRTTYANFLSLGIRVVRRLGDLGGALTFHCLAPGDVLIELAWRPR